MSPNLATENISDQWAADSKMIGHFLLGREGLSTNPSNISFGELGLGKASSACCPTTKKSIVAIILGSTNTQVRRLNANSSVTGVSDFQVIRDGTDKNLIRHSMSNTCCFIFSQCPDYPVAPIICRTSPIPTTFSGRLARHIPPKSFSFSHVVWSPGPDRGDDAVLSPLLVVRGAESPCYNRSFTCGTTRHKNKSSEGEVKCRA